MEEENSNDFKPEPMIPVTGNTGIFPVHYANKKEVKIYYSRNVKIAGVVVAVILITLAIVVVYYKITQ